MPKGIARAVIFFRAPLPAPPREPDVPAVIHYPEALICSISVSTWGTNTTNPTVAAPIAMHSTAPLATSSAWPSSRL